jgi:glycerol-3-phosphate dehydrogenase
VFPAWRLPVAQAVSFLHPVDRRPVFVIPWEGVTLVGTTDVDHHEPLNREPRISPQEAAYLMTAVQTEFPSLALELDDVQATFAGVRPVVGTGKADPSKESREHVVWQEDGLLTVTGGKLTTFRLIALDAITAARSRLPDLSPVDRSLSMLNPVSDDAPGLAGLDSRGRRRLLGRYGALAPLVVEDAAPDELTAIPGTRTLWAELRWAARREHVVHLDDLLLRRVRLGLLLPKGGAELLPQIREICQAELAWDDERWAAEESAYLVLWQAHHAPPKTVPESELQPRAATPVLKRTVPARRVALFLAGLLTVASMTGIGLWRWMVAGRGREKVCA